MREASAKFKALYGKDFSPRRFEQDIREARVELERAAAGPDNQPQGLIRGENGKILIGHENAWLYFQSAKEWAGVVGFNEFTGGTEIRKTPPAPVSAKIGDEIDDSFDTEATRWLERRSSLIFRPDVVHRTIDLMAMQNRFHPVRDYLTALPVWDGKNRLSNWLIDYCGVDAGSDESPNNFAMSVGRKFLISLVARVMKPGCKVDHMLVLEGKTGIGKSSMARALMPNETWFTDELGDMGSKDASMKVRGVWLVEIGELDALYKSEEKTAKRFISQQQERFRLPYGRRIAKFDRQCAFMGTTERDDWSKAETARRFWPVQCTSMDVDGLVADRDQLWAEALKAFRDGEKWHLSNAEEIEEATIEQRKRFSEDVWRDRVLEAIEQLTLIEDWVSIPMVLDKMIIPISQQDDKMKNRIGSILRFEGFEKKQKRVIRGASPSWGYRKPE